MSTRNEKMEEFALSISNAMYAAGYRKMDWQYVAVDRAKALCEALHTEQFDRETACMPRCCEACRNFKQRAIDQNTNFVISDYACKKQQKFEGIKKGDDYFYYSCGPCDYFERDRPRC